MATLSSSDVEATFATYARSIGEWAPAEQLEASAIQPARAQGAAPLGAGGDSQRELRSFIVSWLARRLQIAVSQVEAGRSFADHGLDSVATVELAKALSDRLGRELDETLLWSVSTIDALVAYLVRPIEPSQAVVEPATTSESSQVGADDPSLEDEAERLERELRLRK
jgi:acyl carrier protein